MHKAITDQRNLLKMELLKIPKVSVFLFCILRCILFALIESLVIKIAFTVYVHPQLLPDPFSCRSS